MQAKVQKWGNSLALRIPKAFADEIAVKEDSCVSLSVQDQRLVVSPIRPVRKYTLDELLAQVKEETLHGEADFGPAVGEEAW